MNSPPKAVEDTATTNKNTAIDISVVANDTDADGDSLKVTAVTTPTSGSAVINPNGTIKYTPKTDFTGTDIFSYTISDSKGGTASAQVALTVHDVKANLAPKVTAMATSPIGQTEKSSLTATVTDDGLPNPPGKVTFAWTKVTGPGSVTFANSAATSTTALFSLSGTYTLRFSANDGERRSELM